MSAIECTKQWCGTTGN